MSPRIFAFAALLALPLATGACSGGDMADEGSDPSADELGKVRHHYEPAVDNVHFNGGCGIVTNPPQEDCSYGFVVRYTKNYIDLKTTVSHETNNSKHTITIKLDTWSYNTIHPLVAVGPQNLDLGVLDAKVGQTYAVKVVDRHGKELWSGKVMSLYHL